MSTFQAPYIGRVVVFPVQLNRYMNLPSRVRGSDSVNESRLHLFGDALYTDYFTL